MQYLSHLIKRTDSIDISMTKFKASSSGFVFGTVLLLLVLVINTANAACSGGMMFNSSSLEVADQEFARDSQGTTEISLDHLDRIPGRVLQSVVGDTFKLLAKNFNFNTMRKGVKPYSDTLDNVGGKIDKLTYLQNLYAYLDTNYCNNMYCYPFDMSTCQCEQEYPSAQPSTPGCAKFAVYYCCKGSDRACSECCQGQDGFRNVITTTIDGSTTTTPPSSSWSSSSSLQFPIAYVLLVVIAIMLPSFLFSYTV